MSLIFQIIIIGGRGSRGDGAAVRVQLPGAVRWALLVQYLLKYTVNLINVKYIVLNDLPTSRIVAPAATVIGTAVSRLIDL
jgi:hypothetical protein